METKGEQRTREAIAETFCSMHLTDGFCMPRHNPECRCNKMASAAMEQAKGRGVEFIWPPPKA